MRILLSFLVLISGFASLSAGSKRSEMSAYEQDLFLVPSGKYTEADILANGRQTPEQKYKSLSSVQAQPEAGDKLCPISNAKVHPVCTWVINGKTYSFCSASCIAELVTIAKRTPNLLKEPEAYIKRE
jgi:hypothetical protein